MDPFETNPSVLKKAYRHNFSCSYCPPNKFENSNRRCKYFSRTRKEAGFHERYGPKHITWLNGKYPNPTMKLKKQRPPEEGGFFVSRLSTVHLDKKQNTC
jgi:hypothetical protein